jgi:hypothetical protein
VWRTVSAEREADFFGELLKMGAVSSFGRLFHLGKGRRRRERHRILGRLTFHPNRRKYSTRLLLGRSRRFRLHGPELEL